MNKIPILLVWAVITALPGFAQITLRAGSLTLPATGHDAPFCVQIPIVIEEQSIDMRQLGLLSVTFEISGDVGIIDGNLATEMFVGGGFTFIHTISVTDPGVDLDNIANNPVTPSCSVIHNQATEGFASLTSAPGFLPAAWTINNDRENMGYKSGTIFDISFGALGLTALGEQQLIAVLEIPIIANPGEAVLNITPVPNTTLADGNVFMYLDPTILVEEFDLTDGQGELRFCPQTLAGQPDDVTACPGEDVSFSVDVSGAGPFSYQWYHDDMAIAGANLATLDLTNIGFGDLGAYDCEIGSACATVRTASGTLSIGDFALTVDPPGLALGLGLPTFTATPDCEIPTVTYEWRDSANTLLGDEASLTLEPPPSADELLTLTVVDGDGRMITTSIPVLVNPLGLDLNDDGMNNIEDLFLVLPEWRGDAFDANGNGILSIRDMLYINTGE